MAKTQRYYSIADIENAVKEAVQFYFNEESKAPMNITSDIIHSLTYKGKFVEINEQTGQCYYQLFNGTGAIELPCNKSYGDKGESGCKCKENGADERYDALRDKIKALKRVDRTLMQSISEINADNVSEHIEMWDSIIDIRKKIDEMEKMENIDEIVF